MVLRLGVWLLLLLFVIVSCVVVAIDSVPVPASVVSVIVTVPGIVWLLRVLVLLSWRTLLWCVLVLWLWLCLVLVFVLCLWLVMAWLVWLLLLLCVWLLVWCG